MTRKELCEMCTEYSIDRKCENKETCKLQAILTENAQLKAENKKLKKANEEIQSGIAESKEVQRLQEELTEERKRKTEFFDELDTTKIKLAKALRTREHFKKLFESLANPAEKTIKLQIERDLYKSQYESLLERVLAKAV